jgi:hypothetical protein
MVGIYQIGHVTFTFGAGIFLTCDNAKSPGPHCISGVRNQHREYIRDHVRVDRGNRGVSARMREKLVLDH